MALNSINTNIAAFFAQANIGKASTMASLSIARLSSGDRIVRASDDVAAMSAGTSLRTNVTTLRMALVNTSQGSSLLQVADGALSQVTDILQRQKAISVQAGSGSLTANERGFLDQEFQNLTQEIDRLVGQTNFNGVALLDGSLSEKVDVTDVATAATSATASVTITEQPADATLLILNGTTYEADNTGAVASGVAFSIGGSIQETLDNLVTVLNSSTNTAVSQATYSRSGNSLQITADNGGVQGGVYTIDAGNSTAISGVPGAGSVGTVNGAGASTVHNLFSSNAIAVNDITTVAAAVASAASTPFEIGEILTAHMGLAGTTFALVTVAAADTLESIVNRINANTSSGQNHGYTARIIGSSGAYNIQIENSVLTTDNSLLAAMAVDINFAGLANTIGNIDTLDAAANSTNNFTYYLDGGDDLGIGAGDTVGVGVVGNDIITDQNQIQSQVSIIFPEIADADLTSTTNFGQATASTITIAGQAFGFASNANGPTEAAIGTTLEDTLDNMVAAINSYFGTQSENYVLNQVEAFRDGRDIVIRSQDVGNVNDVGGTGVTITTATLPTGASITNTGALSNGQTGGVTTSGVTNSDFVGSITGFSATFGGTANQLDLSITVGSHTYVAQSAGTNPAANTAVRFSSQTGGGYFDVQLAANNGETVSSQANADVFAQRLNAAFESLTFYQNREISSFTGDAPIITDGVVTGTLIGTSFELQGTDFSDVSIDSIRVAAPQGSSENGSIIISINGEEYRAASNIGDQLGAFAPIEFINENDASKVLTFNTGDTAIEFDTAAKAATFQAALESAFGVGDGSAELQFQVGATVSDTLSVGLNNISTSKLYGGLTLNVLTAANAAAASNQLDLAIDIVTSVRAEVGALQSRFDFAAANVESSIQNQDAARGQLLDTDIASESTAFATAQVQLQAGIAVLAQANLLPQNLLKLIG